MSTVPTPPPNTATEIAAANATSQTTPTPGQVAPVIAVPQPPAEPTPENPVVVTDLGNGRFSTKYLSGETFEGTAAEILSKQGTAHVSTKLWAQSEVAKANQPPVSAPVPQPSPFANPEEAAAAKYAADLVAKQFGYADSETMQRDLGKIQATTVDSAAQATSMQFMAVQPDFNPTPENSQKLLQYVDASVLENGTKEQQIMAMRQAHSFCILNGIYQAKPVVNGQQRVTSPPPPAPVGSRPNTGTGELPPELVATANDTKEVIREKWQKAAALGYVPGYGER